MTPRPVEKKKPWKCPCFPFFKKPEKIIYIKPLSPTADVDPRSPRVSISSMSEVKK